MTNDHLDGETRAEWVNAGVELLSPNNIGHQTLKTADEKPYSGQWA